MNLLFTKILLFVLATSLFLSEKQESVELLETNAINLPINYTQALLKEFNDTIPNDTLFVNRSKSGLPVSYFRKIMTGVCIDGECRLVNIVLHWTVTGRYLGFELPPGEFLSKTEHVKFNPDEYRKLHKLLADPYSLLANFSLNELVPQKGSNKVDAVTSATIADVLDYIVEGAVYTTYTLWNIVYGNTREVIIQQTKKELSPELITHILKSPNVDDQVWGLNHLGGNIKLTQEIIDQVFNFIQTENFFLSEAAINALSTKDLKDDSIQLRLLKKFESGNFGLQRSILRKLQATPILNTEVVSRLASGMGSYKGSLINDVLELFNVHQIKDSEPCLEIAGLLKHSNRYVSGKAFRYLENYDFEDKRINRLINKYKSKNHIQ